MENHMETDRRRHKRYQAVRNAYAVLAPPSTMLGQLLDVSQGGFAFSCVAREDDFDPEIHFDLLLADEDFALCKLTAKVISNFKISGVFFPGSVGKRRIGARFDRLTEQQKRQLETLISRYTIGEA